MIRIANDILGRPQNSAQGSQISDTVRWTALAAHDTEGLPPPCHTDFRGAYVALKGTPPSSSAAPPTVLFPHIPPRIPGGHCLAVLHSDWPARRWNSLQRGHRSTIHTVFTDFSTAYRASTSNAKHRLAGVNTDRHVHVAHAQFPHEFASSSCHMPCEPPMGAHKRGVTRLDAAGRERTRYGGCRQSTKQDSPDPGTVAGPNLSKTLRGGHRSRPEPDSAAVVS
jgi:hypothetical protein